MSDHQIIYCTRKISRTERGTHKQIRCRSLRNYSDDIYEDVLDRLDFPNCHNFENISDTYSNFIQKVVGVIDLKHLLSQGGQNKTHKNGSKVKL